MFMKPSSQKNELIPLLILLVVITAVAVVAVVATYTFTFRGSLSHEQALWGQFGDYLGGTLNPIFGFISVIALILTLAMQTKQLDLSKEELSLTRKELELTRSEMQRTANAQQETADALKQQVELTVISARINAIASALNSIQNALDHSRLIGKDPITSEMEYYTLHGELMKLIQDLKLKSKI